MAAAVLKIAIEAQTAMLQKGFSEAKTAISNLGSSMSGSVMSGMLKANAVMGALSLAADGVRAGFENVMRAVDQMDAIGDAAENMGMSADALTVLGFAAEQTGISQDTLNQSLMRMQNLIGEAAAGSDTAAASLGALGLRAEELKNLETDQQFAAIAEQMQQVESQTDKTRLMMDIFGKSGARLNSIVSSGAEGLNDYGREAESLGLILGDARAKVDEANQSLDKMRAAWRAMWQQIATFVAPAIEAVADAITAVVGGMNRLLGRSMESTGPFKSYETEAKKSAVTITKAMKSSESAAKDTAKSIKDAYRDVPKPADWKSEGIGAMTRGSAAGFSAVQDAQRQRQDEERRHKEMVQWLAKIVDAQKESAIRVATVSI